MSDTNDIPMLSTGQPSTLKSYRELTAAVFGPGPALDFIDQHIADDPDGEDGVVIAAESQMLYLMAKLQFPEVTE
jgi:hypothetical protein